MPRVVLIGYAPEAVDFSDPGLPPGLTAEEIRAGIEAGLRLMRNRGWEAEFCAIRPDASAGPQVERHLAASAYDCAVVGGGVRLSQATLPVLEAVIAAIRRAAPATPIAFNARPEDTADAAARHLTAA